MTVSDNTTIAESLFEFLNNLGEKGFNASGKMTESVLKNPGRAFEVGANIGTAFASPSPKAHQFLSQRQRVILWEIGIVSAI